jgi:hypothetical protein
MTRADVIFPFPSLTGIPHFEGSMSVIRVSHTLGRCVHVLRLSLIGRRGGAVVHHPKGGVCKLKVRSIAPILKEVVYAVATMYRIGRDNGGTTLVCRACTHTERIQDFKRSIGNPRTLAAQAMLKHVHAEHGRETHVRAMAMVMERQHAPR